MGKSIEQELLDDIKFALACNNEAIAIRKIEQYKHFILTPKETLKGFKQLKHILDYKPEIHETLISPTNKKP